MNFEFSAQHVTTSKLSDHLFLNKSRNYWWKFYDKTFDFSQNLRVFANSIIKHSSVQKLKFETSLTINEIIKLTELDKTFDIFRISIIHSIRSNFLKKMFKKRLWCPLIISKLTYSFAIQKEYVVSFWWEIGFLENNSLLNEKLFLGNFDPKLRLVLRI